MEFPFLNCNNVINLETDVRTKSTYIDHDLTAECPIEFGSGQMKVFFKDYAKAIKLPDFNQFEQLNFDEGRLSELTWYQKANDAGIATPILKIAKFMYLENTKNGNKISDDPTLLEAFKQISLASDSECKQFSIGSIYADPDDPKLKFNSFNKVASLEIMGLTRRTKDEGAAGESITDILDRVKKITAYIDPNSIIIVGGSMSKIDIQKMQELLGFVGEPKTPLPCHVEGDKTVNLTAASAPEGVINRKFPTIYKQSEDGTYIVDKKKNKSPDNWKKYFKAMILLNNQLVSFGKLSSVHHVMLGTGGGNPCITTIDRDGKASFYDFTSIVASVPTPAETNLKEHKFQSNTFIDVNYGTRAATREKIIVNLRKNWTTASDVYKKTLADFDAATYDTAVMIAAGVASAGESGAPASSGGRRNSFKRLSRRNKQSGGGRKNKRNKKSRNSNKSNRRNNNKSNRRKNNKSNRRNSNKSKRNNRFRW